MEQEIELNKECKVKKDKLWTMSFLLLWQGQLVSCFGDVLYEIALGFWVFNKTGSTALMGALMVSSTIPRIIIAPFAGVYVDRTDRKKLLVMMDMIRGIAVTFVGIAAIFGFAQIWMVFAAAVIISTCGAFFGPAVNSSLPDITSKSKLVKANSVYSLAMTGSNLLGNPIGGILYKILNAPILFLANGLSYIFSAISMLFMKIPKVEKKHQAEKRDFWDEMKEGFVFIWKFKGLRNLMIMAAAMNFFASMGIVLLIPYFKVTKDLGSAKYGIAAAAMSGGMLLGMLFTSIVNIKPSKRYFVFTSGFIVSVLAWAIFPFSKIFAVMLGLLAIGGFLNAIFNTLFMSTMQLTVPQDMRGKVFSLLNTVSGGLTPIGYGIGGILGEFIPYKYVMSGSFIAALLVFLPVGLTVATKRYIQFDPEKETLEDIVNI